MTAVNRRRKAQTVRLGLQRYGVIDEQDSEAVQRFDQETRRPGA